MRIGNKNFMNLQEAVGWLLENNALPFQSTANYVGNTEIAMSTLINPSPAKVRVGSIIFFADSKVSTVIGVTSNSFICSNEYNNLVDDVAYVSNVAINASGHLITTMSDGQTIDAGLIKQVSNFSINSSQHLIATYNDGTTSDLGAIFSGNITISGNLTVSGGISGNAITGNSIVETMTGYTYSPSTKANITITPDFVGAVKNGNKLTVVWFGTLNRSDTVADGWTMIGALNVPVSVAEKLVPHSIVGMANSLDDRVINAYNTQTANIALNGHIVKAGTNSLQFVLFNVNTLELNKDYAVRYEATFLLGDNLAQ